MQNTMNYSSEIHEPAVTSDAIQKYYDIVQRMGEFSQWPSFSINLIATLLLGTLWTKYLMCVFHM